MDRLNGTTSHVPAFLGKLWRIVDEPSTNDLICWSESGKSFIIRNQSKFARELLPLYYKHNNMASFVRQLNMYGFHKVISVEQGGLRLDRDEMEFAHPYFVQGNEDALEFIKRKISTTKIEDIKARPESLNKVLIDVRQMKGRQEVMDSKLGSMKRENEALWRELSQLRQKHAKQQQIVSKLLQFLVSMMSSQSHRISFKRRMPLMLNDVDGDSKPVKMSRPNTSSVDENSSEVNTGPVIHEVFDPEEPMIVLDLTDQSNDEGNESQEVTDDGANTDFRKVEDLLQTAVSKTIGKAQAQTSRSTTANDSIENVPDATDMLSIQPVNPPDSPSASKSLKEETTAETLPSVEDSMQLTRTQLPTSNAIVKPNVILANEMDGHLDEVQLGLDSLKDFLQGSTYNLDSATLSGVGSSSDIDMVPSYNFSSDTLRQLFDLGIYDNDLPLYELTHSNDEKEEEKDVPLGITFGNSPEPRTDPTSDLVSYNPCLFELVEDDSPFLDTPTKNIFLDDELDMMLTTDRNKLNESGAGFS